MVARAFVQLWVTINTPSFTDLVRNNGIAKYNLLAVKHIEAGHQQVSMVHWAFFIFCAYRVEKVTKQSTCADFWLLMLISVCSLIVSLTGILTNGGNC